MTSSPVLLRKNRALSHPHFESYRLAPGVDAEEQVSIDIPAEHQPRSPFDGLPGLNAGRYHAHIFDRFLTNHLAPGFPLGTTGVAQAAYVDHQGNVVLLRIHCRRQHDVDVAFHPVFQLAQQEEQSDPSAAPQQCPSIVAIDPLTWLVADGAGQVSTLTISEDEQTGRPVATAHSALVNDAQAGPSGSELRPVKLVAARPGSFLAQTIAREEVNVGSYSFASPLVAGPQWSATSSEPLLFSSLEENASLLVGSAALSFTSTTAAQTAEEGVPASVPGPSTSRGTSRPSDGNHPFTWYQTTDALTVSFPLPATLSSSDFDINFKAHHISLSIDLPEQLRFTELGPSSSSSSDAPAHAQPRASAALALERISGGAFAPTDADAQGRKLWGDVDPSASFWTWERPRPSHTTSGAAAEGNEESTGYLTLHLEKRHYGTRWTHLFTPRRYESADDDDDDNLRDMVSISAEPEHKRARVEAEQDVDDVPETVDPSERIAMLEGLEKYTSPLGGDEGPQSGQGLGSGLGSSRSGAGGGVSSLLEDGFEEEDANVGRDAASTTSRTQILGLPLPSASTDDRMADSAKMLIVKDEIDGLAFSSSSASSHGAGGWKHVSTLPALAYVLASKQDASHRVYAHQQVHGDSERVQVLAFEGSPPTRLSGGRSGSARAGSGAGAGNLFVYYSPPASDASGGKGVRHAESRVIRLGAGGGVGGGTASGSLVAVAKVLQRGADGAEKTLLLVLCQNELLVLPELLL
ncbi:unnamed protein product [Tilletia controversa]|nr:unnamed protein product [Tilletia controversa]